MAPLVPGRHYHAVVVRVAEVLASSHRAEERVREDLLIWGTLFKVFGGVPHDDGRLVLVHKQTKPVGVRSLIVDLQGKGGTQSPLDSQTVLIDIRAANVLIFGAETHQTNLVGHANILDQRYILVKTDGPGEFVAAICASVLSSRQVERCVQSHVGRDVVENLVVAHAEAAAKYRGVLTEQRPCEPWRVGKSKYRREIVLIGVHTAIRKREGT